MLSVPLCTLTDAPGDRAGRRSVESVELQVAFALDQFELADLFMKKLIRARVVPTVSASASWDILGGCDDAPRLRGGPAAEGSRLSHRTRDN